MKFPIGGPACALRVACSNQQPRRGVGYTFLKVSGLPWAATGGWEGRQGVFLSSPVRRLSPHVPLAELVVVSRPVACCGEQLQAIQTSSSQQFAKERYFSVFKHFAKEINFRVCKHVAGSTKRK